MAKKKTKTIEQRINERPDLEKFAKGKKWSELINVSDLITIKDNPNEFRNVLGENEAKNPGCYKWWAPKDDVEKMLSKILFGDEEHKNIFSEIVFNRIFEKNKEGLYCVYVGKANELYDRLRSHAKKTEQSTLRRTICSLICNQNNSLGTINGKIDKWLNEFKLQYFPLYKEERIPQKNGKRIIYKLKKTKKDLSLLDLEYFFINEKFHLLNVDENHFADYVEENQLDQETIDMVKRINNSLSIKKRQWPIKIIKEKKQKNR